jgi:hypothetical protein
MKDEVERVHGRNRRCGLLLRSEESLAARHFRITNRLLRHCLPRRSALSVYGQHDLDAIALKLNTRPRKTLGYSTPAATLAKTVALTG